jgi:flavin-dependent dehydrogenase
MSDKVYDFLIIGGGPTGSSAAIYLRWKGYSVLVLEREKFPRQHVGESLLPFCYPLFQELGVLDEMKKRFVRKPGARFTNSDGTKSSTWCFRNIIKDESYLSFHVVRADFDKMLLDHARKHGAEVREEIKVTHANLDLPDHVEVRATNAANEGLIFHGKFLIDATGQDTFLARRLGDKHTYKELDRIAFLTHWKGAKYTQGIDVGLLQICYLPTHKSGWFGIQPVGKDRLSVGLIISRKYLKAQKEKFKKSGHDDWQMQLYLQEIREAPLTNDILENAKIVQPLIAVADFSYYAEKTFGRNFAMLGDAGKFLDPIFASGVYLGMNSSRLFADALDVLMKEGEAKGMAAMAEKKKHIDGAYDLVEKFINIYYDPTSFNLAEISSTSESNYQGYETAFSLVHYLLAGDFFNNYERYGEFLEMLKNPKQFSRWKHLVIDRPNLHEKTCGTTYEEMFREIDDELVKNTSINREMA